LISEIRCNSRELLSFGAVETPAREQPHSVDLAL
jgi:hypothetical protein